MAGRPHFLAGRAFPFQKLAGGLPLPIKLAGGVPPMPPKVSANFGKDWSPQALKKYKRSALSVTKSLCRNFSFNFRCMSHRLLIESEVYPFEHVVTSPGGEPEAAIESLSPKRAFPYSLFCDKHTSWFTLILHYHALSLHSHAHNWHSHAHTCIIMHES